MRNTSDCCFVYSALGILPRVVCFEGATTVTPRYNTVVGRHLLRPPYKRGTLWDPVDLFDIIIPRQSKGQGHSTGQVPQTQSLEVELE